MMTRYRLQLCRQPESGNTAADRSESERLASLLVAWSEVFETAPPWCARVGRDTLRVSDRSSCERAIVASKVPYAIGGQRREAIELTLLSDAGPAPAVEIRLVAGIAAMPLPGLYTPNRLTVLIRDDRLDERAPERMLALLTHGANIHNADFGFVGTESAPIEPAPLYSDGTPAVGWMTYLSSFFGPFPQRLPEGAVAHPQARGGTIIVAQPNLHRSHVVRHREAMAAVETCLRDGHVLRPVVTPVTATTPAR